MIFSCKHGFATHINEALKHTHPNVLVQVLDAQGIVRGIDVIKGKLPMLSMKARVFKDGVAQMVMLEKIPFNMESPKKGMQAVVNQVVQKVK